MKKITLLLSLAFLAFSCSDDDAVDSVNDNQDIVTSVSNVDLIGDWILTSETRGGEVLELDACDLQTKIVFTETLITDREYYSFIFNDIDENGDSIEVVKCDILANGSNVYAIKDGNQLWVTYDEKEYREGEVSISAGVLTLKIENTIAEQTFSAVETYTKVN